MQRSGCMFHYGPGSSLSDHLGILVLHHTPQVNAYLNTDITSDCLFALSLCNEYHVVQMVGYDTTKQFE